MFHADTESLHCGRMSTLVSVCMQISYLQSLGVAAYGGGADLWDLLSCVSRAEALCALRRRLRVHGARRGIRGGRSDHADREAGEDTQR